MLKLCATYFVSLRGQPCRLSIAEVSSASTPIILACGNTAPGGDTKITAPVLGDTFGAPQPLEPL
jgi:hypothetical protein